jgi:alkylation response protein AidB-like acyl-CoA dehydrogenase
MDARLTDEQRRIQETAQEFFESNGGIEFARRQMEGDPDVVEELWSNLADLDYMALTVPPEYGGLGDGMVYLSALLEAVGQYAMPGPFPETVAFAAPLIEELGTEEQKELLLPEIADGNLRVSVALYDDRNESLPRSIQLNAEYSDEGFALTGTKTLVPYGDEVNRVVVAGRTREGADYKDISLFVVNPDADEVDVRQLDGLDRTRPVYDLELDCVVDEDALLGSLHGAGSALERALERYTVARTAMLVGAADRAIDESVEYGNERTQYGHPIGRFQAVKHRIAEMWIDMQNARSLVYYASWALDTEQSDASRAVSATKAFAGDRLHRVFSDDIKNHGGTGFTWDYDSHIYLKQAKAWRNFFGSPEAHREQVLQARLAAQD